MSTEAFVNAYVLHTHVLQRIYVCVRAVLCRENLKKKNRVLGPQCVYYSHALKYVVRDHISKKKTKRDMLRRGCCIALIKRKKVDCAFHFGTSQ